jgi:8-oxo-dGTP pyrophosphatase MutT (NUDIX family)
MLMTKDEFLYRFQLNSLAESSHKYQHQSTLKQAAVLVPLINHENRINILLTKRAKNLRNHGGQISFPGGRVDDIDNDIISTATREAFEEIDLAPQHCQIIGKLHPYQTITGYIIEPIVALLPANLTLTASLDEVEEIFEVPLDHFLNPNNIHSFWVERQQHRHQVHFMPYNQYNIWGATAAILKDLGDHIR